MNLNNPVNPDYGGLEDLYINEKLSQRVGEVYLAYLEKTRPLKNLSAQERTDMIKREGEAIII